MLIPRPYHVHIDPFYYPDKTSSGLLFVPDSAKGRSTQGIVKYVGSSVTYVSPGDYVLFNGYVGETISLPEEGVLIDTHQRNIAAIIPTAEFYDVEINGAWFKSGMIDKYAHQIYFPATLGVLLGMIKSVIQSNSNINSNNNHKDLRENHELVHTNPFSNELEDEE